MEGARIILQIGPIWISETVVVSWIIIAFLAIVSYFFTRNLQKIPKGKQALLEGLVGGLTTLVEQTMGANVVKRMPNIVPYLGSLFLFFACSNIIPIVGLRSPTMDLNTTLAWALITCIMMYVQGIKSQGVKYFKHFAEPNILMLPLHLIGELVRPISLSFRPFGNITGGVVIMELFYVFLAWISEHLAKLPGPFLQFAIPVPLHLYFDIFVGAIQAFIFIMLTMVFVSSVIHEKHHE